jgi:hypothetical protein
MVRAITHTALRAEEWRSPRFSPSDRQTEERVSFETYRKRGLREDVIAPTIKISAQPQTQLPPQSLTPGIPIAEAGRVWVRKWGDRAPAHD